MVEDAAARLHEVRAMIARAEAMAGRAAGSVTLVAVSKGFGAADIEPLIRVGQRVFAENPVHKAQRNWPVPDQRPPGIELHLIGPLQTNKVREAVAFFDVIETLDRPRLAAALAKELARQSRRPRLLVQV